MEQRRLTDGLASGRHPESDEFASEYLGKNDDFDKIRSLNGFPLGKDADLQSLSQLPYFTAYPNPHMTEFVERFGKPYQASTDEYHREPFVGDISEGKGDPYYNVHTYHTKVPYKAISQFIEHYTSEDDVVFDGFCGAGMTGIAAQLLGRHCVLSDLSPVAAFISYNLNTPFDGDRFEEEARRILQEVEEECGWMFETWHPLSTDPNRKRAKVNFVVWNDKFVCPYCRTELLAYDSQPGESVRNEKCENCNATLPSIPERAKTEVHDHVLGTDIQRVKEVPVLLNYKLNGRSLWKKPDKADLDLLKEIETQEIPHWFPTAKLPKGYNTEQPKRSHGIEYVHQMYTKRNLWVFAALWSRIASAPVDPRTRSELFFWAESLAVGETYLNRYFEKSYSQVNRFLKGTLYISSKRAEVSPAYSFTGKIRRIGQCVLPKSNSRCLVSTQSASKVALPDNCIDYVFTDPPFGGNLMYSELNFVWESWLRVFTNTQDEAIINDTQSKGLDEYRALMLGCFREMFRILKPGRWITVVFHNSRADVWNAIQDSIGRAGFIVAQVATLDKQQATMKQWAYSTSVKNDLVINAYKPKEGFSRAFLEKSGRGLETSFVEQLLSILPVDKSRERTGQMLHSRLLAYYVQRGYEVNMDAKEFYSMLGENFDERDGYWFLDTQVGIYERKKKAQQLVPDQSVLFISDEGSAIQWLHHFLSEPKGYDEIYPEYVKNLTTTPDAIPELRELLSENFVSTGEEYRRAEDLEKEQIEEKRIKRLYQEFEGYLEKARSGKRLDNVRMQVVLSGFANCYRMKQFHDIVTIGRRLPPEIVASSTEIYDLLDFAETKVTDSK